MRRILHFLFIGIFLVAGVSQVPACYATNLDCNFKATTTCPMAVAGEIAGSNKNTMCCLAAGSAEKQKSTAALPVDRLKRLKVEQIQRDVIVLPPFVPGLSSRVIIDTVKVHLINSLSAPGFHRPHYRPPPLFIQHQSLLI